MTLFGNRIVGKRIADRYCITGEIGKGGMGVVYRGIPFDDPSHTVAIKVIQRSGRLGYDDLMRFQKEAALMSLLHHPNIVVFHELGLFDSSADESLGSGYYIVMEVADGNNLKQILAKEGRKDLAYFFEIGLQVSQALDYTHGKNIIHRDIKPQNIIVGETQQENRGLVVKVLDFGVARLAVHEGNRERQLDEAAGTPLYMAPEQTRLMQATVDHRVDLYSLGCVLYEVLAGKPPFTANTRDKLEKQHVSTEAEPLGSLRPDVPTIVERIVHKLLAKHPDERYQTAFCLNADLLMARDLITRKGRRAKVFFTLGLKDRFQAVSARVQLAGREKDVATLVEGLDDVSSPKGRSRLSLISGGPGIGKSRLLAEFRGYLARKSVRSVFVSFSRHENSLPFNALANAFNEYLLRVWKTQPHETEELRRRVKALLGATAHEIAAIVPGLKPYLSDIPEPDQLSEEVDDEARIAKLFSDFVRCLTAENQPVVFMFDDLHWADERSLNLIDVFFSNANTQRFFLIVSVRPGQESPICRELIQKFRKLKRRFQELALEPLSESASHQLVTGLLQAEVSTELTQHLHLESKGNPMHLVELTRAIVARDIVAPVPNTGEWQYDMNIVRSTRLAINSIDFVLSRIQEFGKAEREILEIAATAGLSFPFEVLTIGGASKTSLILQTIQLALNDGILLRAVEDPALRHLGKAYTFAHKKARDAIYDGIEPERRRALHAEIGKRLNDVLKQPNSMQLFALAHHFNAAIERGKVPGPDLAPHCIRFNIAAGHAALLNRAWQTAETYFANALRYMDECQASGHPFGKSERVQVLEQLADLYATQRRYGKAVREYRKLLSTNLPIDLHLAIALKTTYYLMVSGMIGDSHKLLFETLAVANKPHPNSDWGVGVDLAWHLAKELMPLAGGTSDLKRLLKNAYLRRGEAPAGNRFPIARLYRLGSFLALSDRPRFALGFHKLAHQEAVAGHATPADTVAVAVERATVLAMLGFTKAAYQTFDIGQDVAKAIGDQNLLGTIKLLRAVSVEYLGGRSDELGVSLSEALKLLDPDSERLLWSMAICFKCARELLRCNLPGVAHYSRMLPEILPTRNWLSPRAVAYLLFGFELQGARDNIVRIGEGFLRRRAEVAGRDDDLFVSMIHAMVTLAKGEIEKSRQRFAAFFKSFLQPKTFLLPFEEDVLGLFVLTFPVIFASEHGRPLMRDSDMRKFAQSLRLRFEKMRANNRTVTALLRARAADLTGDGQKAKGLFDAAIRGAKVENNNVVRILGYFWFGQHFMESGQEAKAEFLKRSFMLARRLELSALTEAIRKEMVSKGLKVDGEKSVEKDLVPQGPVEGSRLLIDHLGFVCDVLARDERGFTDAVAESIATLGRFYRYRRAVLLLIGDGADPAKIVYQSDDSVDERLVAEYVEPYVNIRSPLFLPMSDAPWAAKDKGAPLLELSLAGFEGDGVTAVITNEAESMGATQAVNDDEIRASANDGIAMNAMIPLRLESGTLGVLFLDDFHQVKAMEEMEPRFELGSYGAQLAMIIERKAISRRILRTGTQSPEPLLSYAPGSTQLEQVPWLHLWRKGQPRADRETAWFLGLRFSEDCYVLTYCLLTGAATAGSFRDKLGTMCWHHLMAYRAIFRSGGRTELEARELKAEFKSLLTAVEQTNMLDNISLSFTIFNRTEHNCTSGHFGPSRPLVLGVDNIVTPDNNVVLTFQNGRTLRYWEVAADLSSPHVYLLSYDASRLDQGANNVQSPTVRKRMLDHLNPHQAPERLHQLLESIVVSENIPRYYVGAFLADQAGGLATVTSLNKAGGE